MAPGIVLVNHVAAHITLLIEGVVPSGPSPSSAHAKYWLIRSSVLSLGGYRASMSVQLAAPQSTGFAFQIVW